MRVLLDTDLLLDVALRREEFFAGSAAVLQWAESDPGRAAVAWHSLANLSYLLRPDARPFIRELLEFVEVPAAGTEAVMQALSFPMNDFEDALQAASALAFGAILIVTRNTSDYRKSPVPAITPAEFIKKINSH
jgi:predicted nucleic acid-binding protein